MMVCRGSLDFQEVTQSWLGTQGSLGVGRASWVVLPTVGLGATLSVGLLIFQCCSAKLLTVIPSGCSAIGAGSACASTGLLDVTVLVEKSVAEGPALVKRSSCCWLGCAEAFSVSLSMCGTSIRTLPTIFRVPGSAKAAGFELLLASKGADDCELGSSLVSIGLCGIDTVDDATDD